MSNAQLHASYMITILIFRNLRLSSLRFYSFSYMLVTWVMPNMAHSYALSHRLGFPLLSPSLPAHL